MRERLIDRPQIHFHDLITLFRVGFANGILDGLDRLLCRQHAGDGEETGLHHRVDAAAHPCIARHLVAVDDKELRALLNQLRCTFSGRSIPHAIGSKRRVQQERSARREVSQNVTCFEKKRLMAGNEVCFRDEVGRPNWPRTKSQMRDRHRAGLFRIVNKIALRKVVRILSDNFDRFFVRTDRAV